MVKMLYYLFCFCYSLYFVTAGANVTAESNSESKSVGNSTEVGYISDNMFVDDVDIKNLHSFFNVKVNNLFR